MATATVSHSEKTFLTFGDHEVRVLVDGKEVPHYGIESNEEKKEVSCWIASEAGKSFSVKQTMKKVSLSGLKTALYVDGRAVYSAALREGKRYVDEIKGAQVSATEIQKFLFASLELTDDDTYLNTSFTKTGDIKFEVIKAKLTQITQQVSETRGEYYTIPNADKVHERSKKGFNHHVKLGTKETIPKRGHSSCEELGKLATFVFKYRPLEILQATGIAPRDPIPERENTPPRQSSSSKRKLSDVKREEIEIEDESDEERRLLERLEQIRRNKPSKKAGASGSNKRVKEEPKTYFTPGEVIDLT